MHTYRMKEFAVQLENDPKNLAALTRAVAAAGINIVGIGATDGQQPVVRLVTQDPAKTEEALKQGGYQFRPVDVLCLRTDNKPGTLAEVSEKLAEGGIKVEALYGYATVPEGELILHASDVAKAEKVLGQ